MLSQQKVSSLPGMVTVYDSFYAEFNLISFDSLRNKMTV